MSRSKFACRYSKLAQNLLQKRTVYVKYILFKLKIFLFVAHTADFLQIYIYFAYSM